MDVKEHVYADDPTRGPRDVRTNLEGVEYFFLGNGLIQAAVQVCNSGAGTPVGLLVLRPDRLGPKRDVLTMDPEEGLSPTMIHIQRVARVAQASPGRVQARWGETAGIPTVCVSWQGEGLEVEERFWCADRSTPELRRDVCIRNTNSACDVTVRTGSQAQTVERELTLAAGEQRVVTLIYRSREAGGQISLNIECQDESSLPSVRPGTTTSQYRTCSTRRDGKPEDSAEHYWRNLSECRFSSDLPNHIFAAARRQLPATITSAGRMDGSIWQYNLEWVRDQAAAFTAVVMLGDFKLARTMLVRLLRDFVTDDGDTVDSGRRRGVEDVELDQNGELLLAVRTYVEWTGDASVLAEHRQRIQALAEYPLRDVFRHGPSGLLHNRREYWERHALHGIEDGMELIHQLFVPLGLTAAADLARYAGWSKEAERWDKEASRLKQAMLFDERYGMVHEGRFIKRRKVNGEVQWKLAALPDADLPPGMPLAGPGPHYLNPDTSSILPIALEFVDPRGELARNTLAAVEELWNQNWDCGGYGRYNVSSEPDAPGPWPFASLFVARAYWEAGEDEKAWRILRWLGETASPRAGSWFEFYGPRPTPPCPQVGIIPWTWAEIVIFLIHHVFGVRPGIDDLLLRPRLPRGVDWAETSVTIGSHRVYMKLRRAKQGEGSTITVDEAKQPYSPEGLRLPRPLADMRVEITQE
jgi:hypothetical protein